MNKEILKELGWELIENPIVTTGRLGQHRLYYNNADRFTIQKCSNGCLEAENIFIGQIPSREQLEQLMQKHNIDVVGV